MGRWPFDVLPPLESLMAVQMYLTVMGIPLMCLAGLMDARRRAAADLAARLRFEALLAQVSASLVRPADISLRAAYEDCLARLGAFLKLRSRRALRVRRRKSSATRALTNGVDQVSCRGEKSDSRAWFHPCILE